MLVELQGQIERITYSNEENGFTIARLKVRGRQDLVTVVGNLAAPMPGGVLKMTGEWIQHPKYGEQFKIAAYHITVPATTYGIKKYLGSGLIKGVGPVIAERIVDTFGEKSLDIIEENIEDLARVEGIGKKRIAMIRKAWEDQKEIRQVMLFLQSHGVSAAYAAKIFKFYGDRSIPVVRENPYRLAMDIFGIGFITADSIALNLGFTKDSPVRAEAGIVYVLNRLADEGHVYYPYAPLIEKCREVLSVSREILVDALARLEADKQIRIEALNELPIACETDNQAVYLSKFHVCETGIANRLRILLAVPKSLPAIDPDKALSWVQKRLAIRLAEAQERAVRCAVDSKVMVITGGPGTGKTTIVNAILKIFTAAGARMLTAAPTGRAAKRMAETTGYPAKTLHRLLKFSPARGEFEMNFENPLDCDVLIVDEASMIDTVLMHHLLKAVPATATLILVGDVNQLPSVGPGNVLGDIIASGTVPVIVLEEIFRQARESDIVVGAHRINRGELPRFNPTAPGTDFYFIRKEAPEAVLDIILKLVTERIPRRFGFDPVDDIQVLTPMHRGLVGAGNLNIALQEALNPGEAGVLRGQRIYKAGDKVMQIRNNYDKEIFNGDIGRIVRITPEDQTLVIAFDGREVVYDYADLDEIVLAYAISVHKSQGSEYPVVVMPVLVQHYMLLQRNLIYTGVTRGRNLVILVGTKKALAMGIRNDKTRRRHTRLRHRLG
ncbi:SF1B family DNA helicase RecD2 [Desulfococcus sp.]|uniref:SF1B family DNA helicase RecD2 n=1 Tax=Desulfococcus sp. TaxID=2025834 RepID=UPI003D134BDA